MGRLFEIMVIGCDKIVGFIEVGRICVFARSWIVVRAIFANFGDIWLARGIVGRVDSVG